MAGGTEWENTNHGHLPAPTKAQLKEMRDDPQADRLYRIQARTFFPGYHSAAAAGKLPKDFLTTDDMAAFALDIQRSAYAKKHWPKFAAGKAVRFFEGIESDALAEIFGDVDDNDPTYLAYGADASTNNAALTIAVRDNGLGHSKSVVLHEMAHVINDFQGIMRDHGPDFLGIMLKLVRQYMPEKYAPFVRALRRGGLKWTL